MTYHFLGNMQDKASDAVTKTLEAIRGRFSRAVFFANTHTKTYLESPVSASYITEGYVVPQLAAASLGCGMGVVHTGRKYVSPKESERFFRSLVADILSPRLSYNASFIKNILVWVGINSVPKSPHDPAHIAHAHEILTSGAQLLKREGIIDDTQLNSTEFRGNIMTKEEQSLFSPQDIPRSLVRFTNNLGNGYFDGEHFLELHRVESVVDEAQAKLWDIEINDLLLFYHYSGSPIAFYMGRYFSKRTKHGVRETIFRLIPKILFHFCSWDGISRLHARWSAYFTIRGSSVAIHSPEGGRALRAHKAAVNGAYYHHALLIRRLLTSLEQVTSGRNRDPRLIWSSVHNIITNTEDAQPSVLHTHGSVPIEHSKPVIISGHNNTLAYICVEGANAYKSLHTACNSASTRDIDKRSPTLAKHSQGYTTTIIHQEKTIIVPHVEDVYTDAIIQPLIDKKILKKVVTLRPICAYKE